jgi:polysaccharide export outer membrane protein
LLFFVPMVLVACSSSKKINPNLVYFQNGLDNMGSVQLKEVLIQPNDLLSIQIFSKTLNQEQALVFNIPNTSSGGAPSGYLVSTTGEIDVPVLGSVKAAGLTKLDLQTLLTEKLVPYVKNPSVLVRFSQFKINVLGEVRSPGTKTFTTERVSLMDALSAAGDLTDDGKREDLLVIREQNGKKTSYHVDLRSGSLFQSPVYQLQQNDIVYVSPAKRKLSTLSIDPEKQRKTGLLISIVSLLVTVATLVTTSLR